MSNDSSGFERRAGLTIAVFAAILAITDLLGGKYGDDEILGANERANAFAWFQSKSTKQALVQHQLELVKILPEPASAAPTPTLVTAGLDGGPPVVTDAVVAAAPSASRAAQIAEWEADVARYAREKKEILEGSAAVGEENWALEDENGELGKIVGANRWSKRLAQLEEAGDRFDLGSLFLQLTLVLGAVSLVAEDIRLKNRYYLGMVLIGLVGSVFAAWGLYAATVVS